MNIFVLDADPQKAAEAHLDKHVVKMILEYAQLLSTAHRLIDGELHVLERKYGTKQKRWVLPGEELYLNRDLDYDGNWVETWIVLKSKCYSATHVNHPCAVWVRESSANYMWLAMLFTSLCQEYTHRYGKIHRTRSTIGDFLIGLPKRMPLSDPTTFVQAMPDEYKADDPVDGYKNYYLGPKADFARWTNRPAPHWFKQRKEDFNVSHFERTSSLA